MNAQTLDLNGVEIPAMAVDVSAAASAARMDVDIVSTSRGLDQLADEWQRLFERSTANAYSSYAWFRAAWKHFGDDRTLCVGVARRGDGIVAILPLEVRHDRVGPFRRPFLQIALGGWTTRNTFLVGDDGARAIGLILAELARRSQGWDACRLTKLDADGSPLSWLGSADCSTLVDTSVPSYQTAVADLPASWEEFRRRLGPNLREGIRYKTKKLARHGAVRLDRVGPSLTAPDVMHVDRLVADALGVHPHTWQAQESTGHAIGDPEVVDFVREVSRALAREQLLDLSVLYAGERPVSFVWGTSRAGIVTTTKLGFDARLQDCSPGLVHMAQLAANSINRGDRAIDLGHETLDPKLRWCWQSHRLADVTAHRNRLAPRLIRRWRSGAGVSRFIPHRLKVPASHGT